MGLTFDRLKDRNSKEFVTVKHRLLKTEDDTLVPEGDPRGRWLYCTPGQPIPLADALKYGLVEPSKPVPHAEPQPPVDAATAERWGHIQQTEHRTAPAELKESVPAETKELMPEDTKRKKRPKR